MTKAQKRKQFKRDLSMLMAKYAIVSQAENLQRFYRLSQNPINIGNNFHKQFVTELRLDTSQDWIDIKEDMDMLVKTIV
jgi:hypothetical protein